jgi:hypothetical protein
MATDPTARCVLDMSARRAYDIEAWYRCAADVAIGAIGMEVAAVE